MSWRRFPRVVTWHMSTKPITELTGLARSWSQAPELALKGSGLAAGLDMLCLTLTGHPADGGLQKQEPNAPD